MEKKLGVEPLEYIEKDGVIYAKATQEYEKELDNFRYEQALKRSSIPSFYWDIEFSDYEGDKNNLSYRKMLYYAENFEKPEFKHAHLFCYGLHSTQKTALAINILKSAIKKGYEVNFILAGKLLKLLKAFDSYNVDIEVKAMMNKLLSSKMLLVDDCFDPDKSLMWKNSDNKNILISYWDEFFRDIIVSDIRLILTSNFDVDNIKAHYGNSLYELIDRNFEQIQFTESVKKKRKSIVKNIFKDLDISI